MIHVRIAIIVFAVLPLASCAQKEPTEAYRPYVDLSFVHTGNTESSVLGMSGNVLVSDLSTNFQISNLWLYPASGVQSDGSLVAADADVLEIEFISPGVMEIMTLDERKVTLRVQIDRDGSITRATLLGEFTGVSSVARRITPDTIISGSAKMIYRSDEFAIGQIAVRFNGYNIDGNFRVLTRPRW